MTIDRGALIAEAALAPSVHNVQPARWRCIGDDGIALFEDVATRLCVGDPTGNDARISLGAAAEGLRLAAGRAGLALREAELPLAEPGLVPVAGYRFVSDAAAADPLAGAVDARRSWRGGFATVEDADRGAAAALAGADAKVVTDRALLTELARVYDAASYDFLRDAGFRRELLSWMRLRRSHPRWAIDGLNAGAMAMGAVEARGAGVVLGKGFALLDRFGLARPLLAEGSKIATAAGLVVFHRPAREAPFESGRHFYRLWLRLEAAGFGAAVLAALADDPAAARTVAAMAGVPAGERVVSAFRIGRRPAGAAVPPRARRALDDLLV
ncbi:hypothetical protein [Sphingomonas sp. Leaf4]|uniref:hypothetical protein n=1 Tax=Sphingomonas sp. Leaf4 TaxID=2876553 RepID=UPI001E63ED52|nr:hypothetical protein [Sphingomonas sp. Leaf4]